VTGQLSASNGAADSVPIARRTQIPSDGGHFQTLIIDMSAQSAGQIKSPADNSPTCRSRPGENLPPSWTPSS
jgi:hypothetical protein